ncbi:calmodulin-binding protein [Actinidia rufa]|uniref:Calmodulin-binding protein n=1 Tax=Actinidia rufa TaxID=165716 RepID=A0A7J0H5A1_9ERIC|nr:calmodulin-binding protein [Actinidia rufa]
MKLRLTFLFFLLALIGRSASVPSKDLLGIAPQDEIYYKASSWGTIKCRDGSMKFTKSQLNDDFCDCPDGTDEPGTSACPNGKFYCRNAGHAPLSIYSSRVNDDCCDGSDEYNGNVKCSNTCWEAGKFAREKLKKKIATYQGGVTLRKKEIEQAKLTIAKDEAELSKLKNEEKILKELVQQLKEHKEQIEKAEEKERLQKEKEETEKKEAEEAQREKSKSMEEVASQGQPVESANHDKIGLLEDSPSDQDMGEQSTDSVAEVEHTDNSGNEDVPNNEEQEDDAKKEEESPVAYESGPDSVSKEPKSLSKEELGRLVASRWTGENTGEQTREVDAVKDDKPEISKAPTDAHDEEYEGYDSETEDDSQRYNDDDDEEEERTEDFGEENHDDFSSSYKSVSDDELNLSEAAHVRKEYDDSSSKLSKIQSRISSLTKKLNHDFGPEKEFYSFYDKCFEIKQSKYVYKICPFKQASQEEGHSTTRLG